MCSPTVCDLLKKLLFHEEMAVNGLAFPLGVALAKVADEIGEFRLGAVNVEVDIAHRLVTRHHDVDLARHRSRP